MKTFFLLACAVSSLFSAAQQTFSDSLQPQQLGEIIIIGKKTSLSEKQRKPLGSIDEFLQQSAKVGMIRRGAYAWEPIINGMATERTVITVDGMRIFGACTDKMDPITSYVEVSNLSEATISSGQEGACHGSTIGGAVDLKRNRNSFKAKDWNFNVHSGFESNNVQQIAGASVAYTDSLFYFDTDVMYRNADNYKAGGGKEILFSQFKKVNFSGTIGTMLSRSSLIEGSVIYDNATNVGYPALTMDVALAEALITSVMYNYVPTNSAIESWETKAYFNTITHRMDDTKRPNVPIHMDMPGWSKTYGYYSKMEFAVSKHLLLVNGNGFYNQSVAEMTMYPANTNELPMFMYTWPDVRTLYNGLFVQDQYVLNENVGVRMSIGIGFHTNKVASTVGLESLQIFYPEMEAQRNRFLKSISANYHYEKGIFNYGFGLGYGERAPSVSEGYGFYLYNSFDNFDQIGNPNLKNEKSLESNAFIGLKQKQTTIKLTSSYFHISDYILAKPNSAFVPMTIGASGVKVYTPVSYATIWNVGFNSEYKILPVLTWNGQLVYNYGKDADQVNLPFMSPLSYRTGLNYFKNKVTAEMSVNGNATQTRYSPSYGENRTPDFAILNASFGYRLNVSTLSFTIKLGMENILDSAYSTYSDWNNIPCMGRNLFSNMVIKF